MEAGAKYTRSMDIRRDGDIVAARQMGRHLAEELGFSRSDQALIATAISELTRNIISYADQGKFEIAEISLGRKNGICIIVEDNGPGIADLELALTDGYSTGASLGLGLPGTKRIMDDFEIRSEIGEGVHIRAVKWIYS